MLDLSFAERAEEEPLAQLAEEQREHQRLVAQDQRRHLVCGQRDHRRVKLPAQRVGVVDDREGQRSRGDRKGFQSAHVAGGHVRRTAACDASVRA